ncbi:hypothetical protein G6F57_021784 [Rhizopus arrhizus]|nr:hypothetical protein G6F57_021784 [Rhizopus arrhizus]
MIEAPVFHVNGDDPEAVVFVTKLALDYRLQFRHDIVVDIVCFRKLGHNEQDTPSLTQPLMYKRIGHHPGTRKLRSRSTGEGLPPADGRRPAHHRTGADRLQEQVRDRLVAVPGRQVDRSGRHGRAAG